MEKVFGSCKELLDNLNEGVYIVDKNRKIVYWNQEAERISGFGANEILGRYCFENLLNHVDHTCKQLCKGGCPLHATIADGVKREASIFLHHKDGHRTAVDIKTIPLTVDGETVGAAEIFLDNQKQLTIQAMMNEYKTLALYDQLTCLPNRRYLDSYLQERIKEYEELGIPFAVAMMDLDRFKNVNDTYGHDTGDLVLQMVANTLKNSSRKHDFVGRWGGEEFLLILTGLSECELSPILESVRVSVEASELRNGTHPIKITISIGATFVRNDDTIALMQKRSDNALYLSKENGRNMVTVL